MRSLGAVFNLWVSNIAIWVEASGSILWCSELHRNARFTLWQSLSDVRRAAVAVSALRSQLAFNSRDLQAYEDRKRDSQEHAI